MRVVVDTNILVSALIASAGKPPQFTAPGKKGADLIKPYRAARLVNQIKRLAEDVGPLPPVERSPDPTDDFLPAMSGAGHADYLVTGDKSGLPVLNRHKLRELSLRAYSSNCLCEVIR